MQYLMDIVAAVFALVGGITLFVALFTPKRYYAKRPRRFFIGAALLVLAAVLYYYGGQTAG